MKRCVLFIHGFMGRPEHFDFLRAAVAARGWDAEALLLPGHNADVRAFAATSPRDWQSCVDDALTRLRARYDALVLVTHSMGGLLALNALARDADKVSTLFALALPLYIRVPPRDMKTRLAVALSPHRLKSERAIAARDACGVYGVTALNAVRLLPNTLRLFGLCAKARRDLPVIAARAPCVVLIAAQSPNDETVSPKSTAFAARYGVDVRMLTSSWHFWYSQQDQATIKEWIDQALKNAE